MHCVVYVLTEKKHDDDKRKIQQNNSDNTLVNTGVCPVHIDVYHCVVSSGFRNVADVNT